MFLTAEHANYGDLPAAIVENAEVEYFGALGDSLGLENQNPACRFASFTFNFESDFVGEEIEPVDYLSGLFGNIPKVANIIAIAGTNNETCAVSEAPVVYSKVSYSVDGREISYYSNKLPKVDAELKNPSIVVHGNIQAQSVASVSSQNQVQSAGAVNVSLVKNKVRKNIDRYFEVPDFAEIRLNKEEECLVEGLDFNAVLADGCEGQYKEIGDEKALYFIGQNVHLKLEDVAFPEEKWTVIVDGGNLYIDEDILETDVQSYLTVVAMRNAFQFENTGHIYIAGRSENSDPVKNIRATLIADGSVFSYVPGQAIDEDTGEPKWDNVDQRVASLNDQLLIEGSVYSDNTVGGADIDNLKGTNYLLLGGGQVIKAPYDLNDRLKAQIYDLNYLRLFQLELEICENGLPKDQQCGKCLSIDDMKALIAGEEVLGPEYQGESLQCDGINPTSKYGDIGNGDLIIPNDPARLAKGLDNGLSVEFGGRPDEGDVSWWERENEYEPVFIFYRAPAKDTFIFR